MAGLAPQRMAFRMDDRISLNPFYPYPLLRIQIVLRFGHKAPHEST